MDRLFGDLVSGIRMLVRYPTLSLGAIVTLGVGIGLSTTVFCVVNGASSRACHSPTPIASSRSTRRTRRRGSRGCRSPSRTGGDSVAADLVRGSARMAPGPTTCPSKRQAGTVPGGQLTLEAFRALGVQPARARVPGRRRRAGHERRAARARAVARSLRQRPGYRRPDDSRQHHADDRHRRDAAEVRLPDPRGAVGAAARGSAGDRAGPGAAIPGDRPAQAGCIGVGGDRATRDDRRATRSAISRHQWRRQRRRHRLPRNDPRP